MYSDERKTAILQYVANNGITPVSSLLGITGSSIATLRRDLRQLIEENLIDKSHGTVKLRRADAAGGVPVADDPCSEAKDRIARVAATLVNDGDRLFIGAGRTCMYLTRYFSQKENLVVVTTNLNAVMELAREKRHSMVLLGGAIHVGAHYVETLDEYTVDSLRNLYFDKVFITVNGIDLNYGYSIDNRQQVPLYRHLLDNASDFFLLADGSKYDKRAFALFCEMDKIRNVVVSPDMNPAYTDYYEKNGIRVYTALE
jgi:DeoR/GlpR family transcriptional regulator of sugar metabolism